MQSTHDLDIGPSVVIKRFLSSDRGEADREWTALALLERHAPGLAPRPLSRRRDGAQEIVVMSRVPGVALGDESLDVEQLDAVAAALNELHSAVPPDVVRLMPPRMWPAHEAVARLTDWSREPHAALHPLASKALDAATDWLASAEATAFTSSPREPAFVGGDGNLANFMWDGSRCRLVDFEDSGVGDREFEVADLVEHLSGSLTGVLDADALLGALSLTRESRVRVDAARRVMAIFWLLMLLPGNRAHDRNPPGSIDLQSRRVLDLLG